MKLEFKDHFSTQSELYRQYRPLYPDDLYSFLASLTAKHERAWDCGTGNGQAALALTEFYNEVIATDPSEAQISQAPAHSKINYRIEKGEQTSIEDASIDLITIATALHWFDFDAFYKEVKRVLKPGGVIAAWAYPLPSMDDQINPILHHYHNVTLNDLWREENRMIEKGYSTISFPFEKIEAPQFFFRKKLSLEELIGYINTWSATQRYIEVHGINPIENLREEFLSVWKEPEMKREMTWKLVLRVGRNKI